MACLCASTGLAQTKPDVDATALMKRLQALEDTNKALAQRVDELEKRLADQNPAPSSTAAPTKEAPVASPAADAPSAATPPTATVPETKKDGAPSTTAPDDKNAERDKKTFRVFWDEGLKLETSDEQFRLKIGGRIMFDATHFDVPNYWKLGGPQIDEHDGTQFRRLQLRFSGDVYSDYFYALEVNFVDSDTTITDGYVGMKNIPYVGTVQAGQFSEPFGLEALTYSSYLTFMERAMASQALIPYRSRGFEAYNAFFDQRMTVAAGAFNGGINERSFWSVTGRVTGLPLYLDDGRYLLHLGIAASHRNPRDEYTFSAYPGSYLANYHLNTGTLPVDSVDVFGTETAVVAGPFSMQAEFMRAYLSFQKDYSDLSFFGINRPVQPHDRHFTGYYLQASCLLTGERREYDRATGTFLRVVPRKSLSVHGGGWGAWELAARYDTLNLNDYDVRAGVIGGEARNITAGVNWYLTPAMRLTFNYVNSHIKQLSYEGTMNIFETRFQADF
jgi:phosphate-selective porin OprO/OprP